MVNADIYHEGQVDKLSRKWAPHKPGRARRSFVFQAGKRLTAGRDLFYEVVEDGLEIAPRRLNPEEPSPWSTVG